MKSWYYVLVFGITFVIFSPISSLIKGDLESFAASLTRWLIIATCISIGLREATKKEKKPWSKRDKILVAVVALFCVLFILFVLFFW